MVEVKVRMVIAVPTLQGIDYRISNAMMMHEDGKIYTSGGVIEVKELGKVINVNSTGTRGVYLADTPAVMATGVMLLGGGIKRYEVDTICELNGDVNIGMIESLYGEYINIWELQSLAKKLDPESLAKIIIGD